MGSAPELLKSARATLVKWPGLWLPPLLMNGFQGLAGMPMANWMVQAVVAVSVNVAGFLIQGGWLGMINRALQNEPPRMQDFKDGVNRHGASLVLGNVAYFVLLGGLLALFAAWGDRLYSLGTLQTWVIHFSHLSAEQQQSALAFQTLPAPIHGWFMLLFAWLALAALVSFLLIFWQPVVVLRDISWWRGWLVSGRLALGRFRATLGFILLELALAGFCLLVASAGNDLMDLIGLVAFIFVMIYFKILYASVVKDAFPLPAAGLQTPADLPGI